MTEAEWLACDEPAVILEFVGDGRTDRQLRLFAVACCRRIWDQHAGELGRRAVEVSERFADARATSEERWLAWHAADREADNALRTEPALYACQGLVRVPEARACAGWSAGRAASRLIPRTHPEHGQDGPWEDAFQAEQAIQAALLRDIFENPFRPVFFSPEWRTDTVLSLAKQIYDSREFSAMPILADAFQDAGCNNDDILNHCRDAGANHVRGCWVVDLVLGKT